MSQLDNILKNLEESHNLMSMIRGTQQKYYSGVKKDKKDTEMHTFKGCKYV